MTTASRAVSLSNSAAGAGGGADGAAGISATNGPLAASMERLVGLAATALRSPLAFVILSGDDRRCFSAGSHRPAWLSHDTGAVRRSGLADAAERSPTAVAIRDILAEP